MCFCLREQKNSGTFSGDQTLVTVDESQGLSPPAASPPQTSSLWLQRLSEELTSDVQEVEASQSQTMRLAGAN